MMLYRWLPIIAFYTLLELQCHHGFTVPKTHCKSSVNLRNPAFLTVNNSPSSTETKSTSSVDTTPIQDANDDVMESASAKTSSVVLIDAETGCEVVLLGCFHGAASSASDVKALYNEKTDVLALELCATRYGDLRRDMELKQNTDQNSSSGPWLPRYLNMVALTIEKRGIATGLAAAVLGAMSGLQSGIGGFTPGLEFMTAVEQASLSTKDENKNNNDNKNNKKNNNNKCDVLLVDQAVDETLRKVGTLPTTCIDILKDPAMLIKQSKSLKSALIGDRNYEPFQVQLGKVLLRSDEARKDLLKLTGPLLYTPLKYECNKNKS